MLTFKIVTAAVLFVSVVLRAVIDFLWKDKRTNKYRYTRNGFVIAAIGAAFLNGIILLVDEVQKGTKTDEEAKHRTEVENLMLGALTPDIIVELYTGPTYPTPPRMTLQPPFPGSVAIWVDNTNTFPIYDVEVSLFHHVHDGTNMISSQIMKKFNERKIAIPVMSAASGPVYMFERDIEIPNTKFSFNVRTRRGMTNHECDLTPKKWT